MELEWMLWQIDYFMYGCHLNERGRICGPYSFQPYSRFSLSIISLLPIHRPDYQYLVFSVAFSPHAATEKNGLVDVGTHRQAIPLHKPFYG